MKLVKGLAMKAQRSPFLTLLAPITLALSGVTLGALPAIAAPSLTIQPIGWNVVGLDSNKVADGPNQYLNGARVCNVGDTAATNVTATFVKDGGSSFINLIGGNTLSIASLPAGPTSLAPGNTGTVPSNCYDFYFNIQVTRDTNAYSTLTGASAATTRQQFHIEATATSLGIVRTPTNRELYVEKLVSQNRNAVDSITGPSSVYVGQVVQYTVNGHTAPGGYEQLVFSPVLPVFFQVLSVSSTYTTPTGATNNTIYGDACGWVNDTTSPNYHNNGACSLTPQYSGGKVGANVTTVYTIKVLSTGSGTLTNIIYDFSGSSYHYNSDFGTGLNSYAVTALPPSADLSITKTDGQTTAIPGNPISYTITVTNNGPSPVSSLTVTDTVDARILSPTFTPSTGTYTNSTGAWTGLNLASGASITLTVSGTVSATATGTLTNTATVAPPSGTTDPNSANNTSTDTDTLTPSANLSLTKTHSGNFTAGLNGTYTLTVANSGPSAAGTLTVTDTLPTGLSFVSGVGLGWSCSASGQTVTCTNSGGLAVGANSTITLTVGVSGAAVPSTTNTATVSSVTSDPNLANNTASDPTTVTGVPDLTIAKNHSGTFTQGTTGSYTLVATNVGSAVTSGTVIVSDTLPTGLTPTTASGTGWSCTILSQTVTCTRSDALAVNASYPSLSLTVAIAANATNVTNTATVTGGGQTNITNDSASDPTTIAAAGSPRLRLVKRATAIRGVSRLEYIDVTTGTGSADDNAPNWPNNTQTATQSPGSGSTLNFSALLQGIVSSTALSISQQPQPSDEVEYTIYFLSDGSKDAANVQLCDFVPANSTYVPNTLQLKIGTGTLTTITDAIADADGGYYTASFPAACTGTNNNKGAIVVNVGTVTRATGAGTPSSAYGFIRFRAKIN